MIDCPNAEMRDRLPDLLHERLDAATRAATVAHVHTCAACRAELALLRALSDELSRVPTLDVGGVARVVVARTASHKTAPAAPRRRWSDWRIAAAIAVLVVGGASVATFVRSTGDGRGTDSVASSRIGSTIIGAVTSESAAAPAAASVQTAELSMGGGVADLSDSDLEALLGEIQALDAVPDAEPEPVAVRVSLPGSGGSE